ncbi:hypothetical protein J4Q44_G00185970 [Coregonus suidteri]|uniref:Uncharacterized protein n=1 Tax=Coregonus suidteri TaxID=861788 RepID=A0AAN8LLH1_9TELE
MCPGSWRLLIQAGDFVFTTATKMGGYAEYTFVSEDCVQRLPASLDYKQGAAIGIPYFTAYRALFHKAHAKAGETTHPWSPRQGGGGSVSDGQRRA